MPTAKTKILYIVSLLTITYSTITSVNLLRRLKRLSSTNLRYASLILSLLNKKPMYVILASNLEDLLVSFSHVCALYLVLPRFLQRYRAS
jgi:hypothetical protein